MYSVDEIKELLKAFDASKATKLSLKNEKGEQLTLVQKNDTAIVSVPPVTVTAVTPPTEEKPSAAPFIHEASAPEEEGKPVTAPMIGVFYAAPSPDKEP